jgi:CheY-like chemotaxis protein
MRNDERNPNLKQDLPQHRVYRVTTAGKAALARPEGRVSRGFLRLLSVLDGAKNLNRVQEELPYLTQDDLILWCDELARQKLVERTDDSTTSIAHVYSGFIDFERDAEFATTVEKICSALDRTQPMPDRPDPENQRFVTAQTARLVAIEALSTTRRITVHGFFAYASRRADGKSKPPDFRILIVQDDHLESQMANLIASKDGYMVSVAHSIVAFRGALRAQLRPDLVLLDVDLPDGNGFQELEALRAKPEHARLCVVMLTARSDPASIAQGVLLGANGYVTKPYSPATLQGAIRKALNLE